MKTLIIVDMLNDFVPGGALAIPGGDAVIPVINRLPDRFDLVVATQDWHPPGHKSFASSHAGKKAFDTIRWRGIDQVLWPDHCVQGTPGAAFHPDLDVSRAEAIIRKGTDPGIDSYSGFFDNNHLKCTGLAGYLRERQARDLYFCGLAADICVYYSIKDALAEGFNTWLIQDATRPWSAPDYETVKTEMIQRGGRLTSSAAIIESGGGP